MSSKLIEAARKRKAAAELARQQAQLELAAADQDVEKWTAFIEQAELLTNEGSGEPPAKPRLPNGTAGKVQVKADSWAGRAALIIRTSGPMTVARLVEQLQTEGHGQGLNNFYNTVSSALWRRKEDLFDRDEDDRLILRTKDVVFVE